MRHRRGPIPGGSPSYIRSPCTSTRWCPTACTPPAAPVGSTRGNSSGRDGISASWHPPQARPLRAGAGHRPAGHLDSGEGAEPGARSRTGGATGGGSAVSDGAPSVTVIVVPREQFSVSSRALKTLYERSPHPYPFSLIYVDGGSPRAIRRQLEAEAKARGFTLIRTESYLTPNQARNLALTHVKSKYVVALCNDVLVTPGALDALVRCAEETGASVVGPVTCIGEPECEIIHSAGGLAHIEESQGRRRLLSTQPLATRALRG